MGGAIFHNDLRHFYGVLQRYCHDNNLNMHSTDIVQQLRLLLPPVPLTQAWFFSGALGGIAAQLCSPLDAFPHSDTTPGVSDGS